MVSKHTDEGAAFESCPYTTSSWSHADSNLSHHVTNPPDKRKKIRAFQTLRHLTRRHHVHVAKSACSHAEMTAERELAARCQFGGTAHEGLCVGVCGTAASQSVSNCGGEVWNWGLS